jgi:hypothetical protein
VVSCGMPAGGPLWWRAPSDSSAVPWALAIETEPDDCKVTRDSVHFETIHKQQAMSVVRIPPTLLLVVRSTCW